MRLNSLADFAQLRNDTPEAENPQEYQPDFGERHPYLEKALGGVKFNEGMLPGFLSGLVGGGNKKVENIGSSIGHQIAGEDSSAPEIGNFIGRNVPTVLSGGRTLAGQTLSAGATGAMQADPNQENLFGYLPNGRLGAGLTDALMVAGGGRALEGIPKAASMIKGGWDYIHPAKEASRFMSTIGNGTAKENIENLGKRVQYAKGSAKEEALIPKRELYAQEGNSDVYNLNPEQIPEGNLPKMAQIINPEESAVSSVGDQGFTPDRQKALSKAIGQYRKTGDIEHFFKNSEDIFNIPELPEKAESQLEDALSLPTKRNSKYFSNKKVEDAYGDNGKIQELHDAYKDNSTLKNYDSLQSAIKKEQRKYSKMEERGTISDYGAKRLNQLDRNIKNLDADKEEFMQTLPQNMQNLENDFRHKYAKNVGKYEKAPLVIRKLASGKWNEIKPSQIGDAFTNMTAETKDILSDLGPSAAKNILYNAIQHVPVGDAEGLAKTILDLKQTKGYDHIIDQETEKWATNMLSQAHKVNMIKKGLMWGSGILGVGGLGGLVAKHL